MSTKLYDTKQLEDLLISAHKRGAYAIFTDRTVTNWCKTTVQPMTSCSVCIAALEIEEERKKDTRI